MHAAFLRALDRVKYARRERRLGFRFQRAVKVGDDHLVIHFHREERKEREDLSC